MGLPRDGGADGVGDAHRQRAAGLAVAERVQSVSGLAGLRDEETNVISVWKEK